MSDFGYNVKPIKFMSGVKNYGLVEQVQLENDTEPNDLILDFDTNEIRRDINETDINNFGSKLGSMCYYIKLTHLSSRETDEEYEFKMLFNKYFDYTSWDKLQDTILFNTGNRERIDRDQREIKEPPNFHEICKSQIGFKKETFFICNVIGDNHYYREQTTNQLVVQYFKKMDTELNLNCDFVNIDQDKPTEEFVKILKQYWGHKLSYLTKTFGNGTNRIDCITDMRDL